MKLNRRKFFGVAATSPIAAKQAAEKVIEAAEMEISGMSLHSDSLFTGLSVPSFDDDYDTPTRSLWQAIKEIGMPEWKRDDVWDDAKRSRTVDPDIASLKSVSMSAKLDMQWRRNYDTIVRRAHQMEKMERLKRQFFKDNSDVAEY